MKHVLYTFVPNSASYTSGGHLYNNSSFDTLAYLRLVNEQGATIDKYVPLGPYGHSHQQVLGNESFGRYALFIEGPDELCVDWFSIGKPNVQNRLKPIDGTGLTLRDWFQVVDEKRLSENRVKWEPVITPAWWRVSQVGLDSLNEDLLLVMQYIMRQVFWRFPESVDRRLKINDLSINDGLSNDDIEHDHPNGSHVYWYQTGKITNAVDISYPTSTTNWTMRHIERLNLAPKDLLENPPVAFTDMWNTDKTIPKLLDCAKFHYLLSLMDKYFTKSWILMNELVRKHMRDNGYSMSFPNIDIRLEDATKLDHKSHIHTESKSVDWDATLI